ncbi:MAG: hypothetical protein ACI4MH_05555 [Candidatus Coproplasma sp.]
MGKLKTLFAVLAISIVLAGLVALLFLISPEFEATAGMIAEMTIAVICAFFVAPSAVYVIGWAKSYFESLSLEQSVRQGFIIGYVLGGLMIVLMFAVSPVTGTLWYVQTFKQLKPRSEKREDEIFGL